MTTTAAVPISTELILSVETLDYPDATPDQARAVLAITLAPTTR